MKKNLTSLLLLVLVAAYAQGQSSFSKYAGPSLGRQLPATPQAVVPAPCTTPTTLTQSTSQTITGLNSVACNGGGLHTDNSYWRAFTLATDFVVSAVEIGVEVATSASGSQPITVRIYENTGGAFPGGTRTQVGTANYTVPDQSLTIISVPITATLSAGAEMVVEVFTPNGQSAQNSFFIGSNALGESGPSYLSAAECGVSTPTSTASLGFPNMHIVMNVIGCPNCTISAPTLTASKTDVCPNTEVTLTANCSDVGAVVNWNPGAPTVTPNAPDVAYTYKASCSLNGCTSDESSVVVRTHRILVDLKDVGLGAQPKAIVGPKKDNLAPTNAISAAVSPRLWTILATGCSSSESAVFKLTGPVSFSSIDNNPPYAIFANVGATYFAQDHPNYGNGGSSFPDGTYNLVVDLRAADGVGGPFPKNRIATGSLLATRSLQFTVSASGARFGGEDLSLEELNWASIFQNPVSEEIVVRLSGTVGEEVSLGLVNLQGQTVQGRQVKLSSPQQYEVLNVRQQNAGMYILKAIKGDKVKTIKVVKAE